MGAVILGMELQWIMVMPTFDYLTEIFWKDASLKFIAQNTFLWGGVFRPPTPRVP